MSLVKLIVALYARVSTDKCDICNRKPPLHPQCGHEFRGQDPEVQLSELREWCAAQGYQIEEEYIDRGLSGKKGIIRPELNRLMHDAEKGLRHFKAVVVWRLNRFGRSRKQLQENIEELEEYDIRFISKQENFDTTTPSGRLCFEFMKALAQFDREVISENTKAGMKHARAKGHHPGPKIDPEKGPCRMTRWRQEQRNAPQYA